MAIVSRPFVVRETSKEDALRRLKQQIAEFERTYEVSSEAMLAMLQSGQRSDTAEIARWMVWYRALQQLSHERSS